MREIKFRSWLKREEKMFYDFGVLNHPRLSENEASVIMQYVGLKDKNGKEIYEGDVVKAFLSTSNVHYEIREVKYVADAEVGCGFLPMIKHYFDYKLDYDRFEVIGNIYENPHLLEGK